MKQEVKYSIKKGTGGYDYELWSIVYSTSGNHEHYFICEGSFEYYKNFKDRLECN